MTNPPDVAPVKQDPTEENDDATSAHDALFHRTFSKPEHAREELMCILGKKLAKRFDWDSLTPLSNKFVDAKLSGKHADVLFSVRVNGRETLLYILMEHKSKPETWTLLQLLEYKARVWRLYVADPLNKGKTKLPVILPIVVHHSERGWTKARRFRDLFDVAPEDVQLLKPYMLDFGILMDDVGKLTGEAIVQRPITPEARLVLFALRFGRTPKAFFRELHLVVPVMYTLHHDPEPHGGLVNASIIAYMTIVGKMKEADVRTAMQQALGDSIAEEIIFGAERRYAEGVLNAERKGKREASQALVKDLLVERFGTLSAHASSRIDAATIEELKSMSRRLLTANTIDEVLGSASTETR